MHVTRRRPRIFRVFVLALVFGGMAAVGLGQTYSFTTFAGSAGNPGGGDGSSTDARFNFPNDVAVDSSGNVYVADTSGATIRKITPQGVTTTLAGSYLQIGTADGTGSAARFYAPRGITVGSDGNIYLADTGSHTIRKVTPAGVVTTLAGTAGVRGFNDGTGPGALFSDPIDVAAAAGGILYVADFRNNTIRKISPGGVVTTLAGQSNTNQASSDGTGSAARFFGPSGVAVDGAGMIYVADSNNHLIRKITPAGVVTTLAGSLPAGSTDGTGTSARFNFPYGVGADAAGNVFVGDTENHLIRRITPAGVVTTIGGLAGAAGSADGVGSTARFYYPIGIDVASNGTLYIADSNSYTIRRGTMIVAPVITDQPASVTVATGTGAILTVGASGAPLTYQWKKNGLNISGATNASYTISSASAGDAGSYTVSIVNSFGTVTSNAATVTVSSTTDVGRLLNLSVRTTAGTGSATLIVGFVVGGNGTTGTKAALIRAIGPQLTGFGVAGALADPVMQFLDKDANLLATNDNWNGDPQITAIGRAVGAFDLAPTTGKDAALYNAAIASTPYSVKILGAGGTTGIALAEIYDATPAASYTASTPRLINVSARTQAGTGAETLIAGFVIGGSTARTVLIRGIGPRLADYGVAGAIADPQLQLYRNVAGESTLIGSNDDWGSALNASSVAAVASQVGAFALNAGSKDAVLLVTLPPGVYSAQVSGTNNTTGIALAEVYEVP